MPPKIASILADLYALDPSLKEQEAELIPVIEALLLAKPEFTLDVDFTARLKQQLTSTPLKSSTPNYTQSMWNMPKFALVGLGGLVALVIAVPLTYTLTSQSERSPINTNLFSANPTVTKLGANAFGDLVSGSDLPLGAPATRSSVQTGGDGLEEAALSSMLLADEDAKMSGNNLLISMPYPQDIIEYDYVYTGTPLDLTNIKDTVYRSRVGLSSISQGRDLVRAQYGPVDLSNLNNLNIQSFSAKQDSPMGYTVYVDALNGHVSVSGNEGHWQQTDYSPIKAEQVMSTEDIIATANKFLADFKVDTKNFGQPEVNTQDLFYALAQPAEFRYLPEMMTVTYPYLLDGEVAHDSNGQAYGLQVSVSMRTKAVNSLWVNIISSFETSSYELERDADTILKIASQGGIYSWPVENASQTVNIELGTPELILVKDYLYSGTISDSLFIPALSFPVTKNSETYPIYQNQIIIPLVKSALEQTQPKYELLEAR